MDRDNRWDRIQKAYKAIIEGTAQKKTNQIGAIEESYKKHVTDEFFEPLILKIMMVPEVEMVFLLPILELIELENCYLQYLMKILIFFIENTNQFSLIPISMIEYSKGLRKKLNLYLKILKLKIQLVKLFLLII